MSLMRRGRPRGRAALGQEGSNGVGTPASYSNLSKDAGRALDTPETINTQSGIGALNDADEPAPLSSLGASRGLNEIRSASPTGTPRSKTSSPAPALAAQPLNPEAPNGGTRVHREE